MKKTLSILLTVAMLLGVMSVAFTAVADAVEYGVWTDLVPTKIYDLTEIEEDDVTTYQKTDTGWRDGGMTFDYTINANDIYVLSFDYKGHNHAAFCPVSAMTVTSSTGTAGGGYDKQIKLFVPSSRSTYQTLIRVLKGSDLMKQTGGEYFAIRWSQMGEQCSFKNIKIMKCKSDVSALAASYMFNANKGVGTTDASSTWLSADADGSLVYNIKGWTAGSIVFNYEIEAGYTYHFSYQFRGSGWKDQQACSLSTTANLEDTRSSKLDTAILMDLPDTRSQASTYWADCYFTVTGDQLLATKDGGKYLMMSFVYGDDVKFKNLSVLKEKTGEEAIIPTKLYQTHGSIENNERVYTSETYNSGSITFDKEIKADKYYTFSFDFMGHNVANLMPISLGAVATTTTTNNDRQSNWIRLGLPSSQTEYVHITRTYKGSDILATNAGGLYPIISWSQVDPAVKFKNFEILELSSNAGVCQELIPTRVYDIDTISYEADTTVYKKTDTAWRDGGLTFDYEIDANSVYLLSFDYMGHNYVGSCPICAQTVTTPTGTVGGGFTNQVSLNVPSTKTAYTTITCTLKGSDLLKQTGGKYLAIRWSQLADPCTFKNLKITKVNGGSNSLVPSKLFQTTASVDSDNNIVYTSVSPFPWCDGSMVFDYEIEPGYTYHVSFDYKGHNWAGQCVPCIGTTANKSDSLGGAKGDFISLGVPSSQNAWAPQYFTATGEQLLATNPNGKYLAIKWSQVDPASNFKNMYIVKEKTGEEPLVPTKLYHVDTANDNGERVYVSGTWNDGSITFDKEIKSGKYYYISFDFKGHNWAQGINQRISAMPKPTTANGVNDTNYLPLNLPSSKNSWTHIVRGYSGDALLATYSGGKYFCINWYQLGDVSQFKNFHIVESDTDLGLVPTATLNAKAYADNDGVGFDFSAKNNEYALMGVNTGFELDNTKKYAVTFEYKYSGGNWNSGRFGFMASNSKYESYLESNFKNGDFSSMKVVTLPSAVDWTDGYMVVDATVGGFADSTYKYLTFFGQTLSAIDLHIRNIKVVEYTPETAEEIAAKKKLLYDESVEFFESRITSRGYALTSATGAYEGEFIRDASMETMAFIQRGDITRSRKLLNFLLSFHKAGNYDFARHVVYNYGDTSANNVVGETADGGFTRWLKRTNNAIGLRDPDAVAAIPFVPTDNTLKSVSILMSNGTTIGTTKDMGTVTVNLQTNMKDDSTIIASSTVDWELTETYQTWKKFPFDNVTVTPGQTYYFVIHTQTGATLYGGTISGTYATYLNQPASNLNWYKCDMCGLFKTETAQADGTALGTVEDGQKFVQQIVNTGAFVTGLTTELSTAATEGKVIAKLYKGGYGSLGTEFARDEVDVADLTATGCYHTFYFNYPLIDVASTDNLFLVLEGKDLDGAVTVYGSTADSGLTTSTVTDNGETAVVGEAFYHAYASSPNSDDQQQTDGTYMLAVAWAMYVDNCKMTEEDQLFIEQSYPVIKRMVNYYLDTDGYVNEWGLIYNPKIEHARDGVYWKGYNMVTESFASQAFYMMSKYAASIGDTEMAAKWDAADKMVTKGIEEHLIFTYDGKPFYGELYGRHGNDPDPVNLETDVLVGFSYETLSMIGANWHGIDFDILANTLDYYNEFGSYYTKDGYRVLDTVTSLNVTFDPENPTNILEMSSADAGTNHGVQNSGKTLAWEQIGCQMLGRTERLDEISNMVASLYRKEGDRYIYWEGIVLGDKWEMGAALSDRGNQENAGVQVYSNSMIYNEYTDYACGDVNMDGKVNICDLVRLNNTAKGEKNPTARSNVDGLRFVDEGDVVTLITMLLND